MSKLTKLSAAALLALCLTACDKPASKAPEAAQTQAAAPAQQAQAEAPKEAVNTEADFKKFQEWQHAQEQELQAVMAKAVSGLDGKAQKDQAQVQTAINKAILDQVEKIKQTAATLDLKDAQVNTLKEKALQAIDIGAKMMIEGEKAVKAPSEETNKVLADLQAQLAQVAQEGQKIESELAAKYAPAPAPVPDPAQPAAPQAELAAPAQPAAPAQK